MRRTALFCAKLLGQLQKLAVPADLRSKPSAWHVSENDFFGAKLCHGALRGVANHAKHSMRSIRGFVLIVLLVLVAHVFVSIPSFARQDEAAALSARVTELYRAGKYSEAIPLAQRALAILEKTRGPNHLDVARALNNLAAVYQEQGRYADAEPLYKRSLAIREKALGHDHPDVATTLSNLGSVYYDQGRYADAEPLDKRSLAIREKALGPDHPLVALSLNNLAALYQACMSSEHFGPGSGNLREYLAHLV